MSRAVVMSTAECMYMDMVKRANSRLIEMGCPLNGLATVRQGKNRSTDWNMQVNIREGALRRLAALRDVPPETR